MNHRSRPTPASLLEAVARSEWRGVSEPVGARPRRLERLGVGALATIVCTALWTALLEDPRPPRRPAAERAPAAEPAPVPGRAAAAPERRDDVCPSPARAPDAVAEHAWLSAPAQRPALERTRRGRHVERARAAKKPARAHEEPAAPRRLSPLKPNPY